MILKSGKVVNKMYGNFLKSELKKWSRDSMMGFMALYPFVFGLLGRYLFPWLENNSGFSTEVYGDLINVMLVLVVPISFGALIAFSILEDRDDNILGSVKVSPLSLGEFISFRLILILILSFVTTVFVLWFSDIGGLALGYIFAIGILAALEAPMYGLLINCLSNNKIEGFAVMKGLSALILFPIIALFFIDKKELFFAFAPGFWYSKALSSIFRGEGVLYLSFYQYYFIGLAYLSLLNVLAYFLFKRRLEI